LSKFFFAGMMLSESARTSWTSLPAHTSSEIPALTTCGEYTVYPMQYCTEDQVAKVFSKVCQRGNPVLQGRPAADLITLGRAMYRKANRMSSGQVAVHNGEPVAVGFGWDAAEGGVWKGSGLEMPASLAAHAACGKAAFESLTARGETFFGGFYGVLPPHDGVLFGYLAVAGFMMAQQLGFQDGFQYTLLPTLNKRGGVFGKFGEDSDNMNWHLQFSEIADAADMNKAVSDELRDMGGTVNISLTSLNYAINGTEKGTEWMDRCAATVKLPSTEHMRRPSLMMATNQVQWMRGNQSTNIITSRL
jgi:hypothetical protein